jgi:hypothetical protein
MKGEDEDIVSINGDDAQTHLVRRPQASNYW